MLTWHPVDPGDAGHHNYWIQDTIPPETNVPRPWGGLYFLSAQRQISAIADGRLLALRRGKSTMPAVLQQYRRLAAALDAMSDVLVQFDEPQLSADGRMFTAEVRGNRLPTGLWEAWIEFQPRIGGDPVRTPRETEQLSRGDLRFWAAGITRDQLRDALARALAPQEGQHLDSGARLTDADAAAEGETVLETTQAVSDEPVLDPFAVYRHSGEYTLRQELRGLDAQQLADIIGKYRIADIDVIDLARTYEDALAERIVADVQHNVDTNRTASSEPDSRAEK